LGDSGLGDSGLGDSGLGDSGLGDSGLGHAGPDGQHGQGCQRSQVPRSNGHDGCLV
jgi:hypothetical protein